MTAESDTKPAEQFYGRRKGKKLRPNRVRLVEELLPKVQLTVGPELDAALRRSDGSHWPDIWLEVGFGAGEHLAWQAAHHKDVLLIGSEPYINGVAKLLEYVETQALDNVRIFPDDARKLMDALPGASLGRVFVLFNDPWPKTRHWERRFIGPANLDRLARLMKPGAELRLATDDKSLLDWMLFHTTRHPAFAWKVESAQDWLTRPADWPPTRYELKAIRGRPYFLTFVRR